MSERRILLLNTDLEIGGTPTVVRELAIRLSVLGRAHLEVASLKPPGPVANALRQRGILVHTLNARSPADFPRAALDLAALLRKRRFDTLFSFLIHANALASAAVTLAGRVRLLQSIQTTQPNPVWHWRLQNLIHRAADRIVVPSRSAALCAMRRSGISASRLSIIPNAVELPADYCHRPRGDEPFRVGFIGRLDPIKRVGILVRAMDLLDDNFDLAIWGEGPDGPAIEREIARGRCKERIHLKGVTENPWQALANMDALVLPSAAEGFGLVLIEAMAAGVPVIATNAPGIRDVVQTERTGLLVPIDNSELLAAAIQRLASDSALYNQLKSTGQQNVTDRFSWPSVLKVYRELLHID